MTSLILFALVACTGDPGEGSTTPDPEPSTTPEPTPTPTVTTPPTGDTGAGTTDTGFVVIGGTGATADTGTAATGDTAGDACELALYATAPLGIGSIPGIPSTEEFEFDAFGDLINVSDSDDAIMRTDRSGNTTLIAPYSSSEVAGTRIMPNGDIVFADEGGGSVVRVDPATGARSVLASGLSSPNSLAVNSAGEVFVAGYGDLVRIKVDGTIERVLDIPNTDFDGAVFSPDESVLYLNHDDGGTVGRVDFDASGNVTGFTGIIDLISGGWGNSLDGAAVDACGRIYVIDTSGLIFRVDPVSETVIEFADLDSAGAGFTTAVRFGSGVGGWERDHLYAMDRDGLLWDLTLDVEGALLPHL